MHARFRPAIAVIASLAFLAACTGSDGDGDAASTSMPASVPEETTTVTEPAAPQVVAPDLTVTGPIAGTPQTTSTGGMDAAGYVEEEYFVAGTARAFDAAEPLTDDGHWALTGRDTAPFTTRILVRRPVDPAAASGTVIVEWNNVSAGFDSTPDWSFTSAEMMRSGHVYIGVSAQKQGVDGEGPGLVGALGSSLASSDPGRYGSLSHPGDDYSYDLFRQIGALAKAGPAQGLDPLQGFPRDHVIAVGESQSAFRLTAYANGLQALDPVFDGFLIHSRGGGSATFDESGDVAAATDGSIHIRDDLDVPVFVFSTETDLTLLGYAAARQPDTDRFRGWEVAGTAHADAHILGGADPARVAEALGCDQPVNDGPQHLALKAALAHLVDWVVDGTPPPRGEPISLDAGGAIVRDDDGNARGGIRLPAVEVPVATLSGEPVGDSVLCRLFGSTTPFPPEELTARYGSKDAYLAAYGEAYDRSVAAGFALAADRATALAEAAKVDFG